MNSRKLTVGALLVVVLAAFLFGIYKYQRSVQNSQMKKVAQDQSRLLRFHSPTLGPANAPVTIVEFFDPACETCRAFFPVVKNIMAQYPNEVRLVIRYAPFHQGSDQVVKLLEASRKQGKYWLVLESVLAAQQQWADHGNPNLQLAFQAAAHAGLDIDKLMLDIQSPDLNEVLKQDVADLTALRVDKTPTFFVNGRNLPSFGEQQLRSLVAEEVAKAKK
ncbi:disulfide bond formation protein DsbA [Variovorax paradoxus]|jgi:protein-disulfide isomerase|uniref:Disulfide bond formation protein DsbA n=1 Tax=Variovorax paradoxus TaxID=34073 RepID=A0AA91IAX6_VARPD|nr:thioredoxin domain-containing protein [Variovorax paradoxus]OAK63642.1 disulfide bond formation protein DsbA [Variovorax paradoxus]